MAMRLRLMVRHLIENVLARFGYEPRKTNPRRWESGRTYWAAEYLRRLGFAPRTIVDVGVAYGSPSKESHALYEAFPQSDIVLIEPLKEFEPYVRELLRQRRGAYFPIAIGAQEGKRVINIQSPYLARSSLYTRTLVEFNNVQISQREVPVTTLDTLLSQHQQAFHPPFGLKIDTEGCEAEVIEGASQFLQQTEFVIAEVAVAKRFEGCYSFAQFIALMDTRGFCVCDILDIGRADTSEVTFFDLVFKKLSW